MIDEAAKLVAKKTGLSQAKAKEAVLIVIDVLKKQIPSLAPEIDALTQGGSGMDQAEKLAKGLFGGKK